CRISNTGVHCTWRAISSRVDNKPGACIIVLKPGERVSSGNKSRYRTAGHRGAGVDVIRGGGAIVITPGSASYEGSVGTHQHLIYQGPSGPSARVELHVIGRSIINRAPSDKASCCPDNQHQFPVAVSKTRILSQRIAVCSRRCKHNDYIGPLWNICQIRSSWQGDVTFGSGGSACARADI